MNNSHKNQAVLDDFLSNLRDELGQKDKLIENKGLLHENLGIMIDYSIPRKVILEALGRFRDCIV